MGTGTKPYNFLKAIYIWVIAIILCLCATIKSEAYVNTQLRNFSKPEPIIQKTSYKTIEIYHEIPTDPGDPVLWIAPPYKELATKLAHSEESLRYQQALKILVDAAFKHDVQLNNARKKLKNRQFSKLSADLIQQISNYKFETSSGAESEIYIRNKINEINKQFKIYASGYFISSRDQEWLEQINLAQAFLSYHCSQAAIHEVNKLYLRGINEGTNQIITDI